MHFCLLHIFNQVTLKGNGCFSFNDSQTIKSRTGLRKPEPGPVQEARVRNSTKNTSTTACVVEWKHSEYDLYKQSHLRYQVNSELKYLNALTNRKENHVL